MQQPRGAAGNRERGRRLPAIDRQGGDERARTHGMKEFSQRQAGGGTPVPNVTHATPLDCQFAAITTNVRDRRTPLSVY
jgi:hypothetical protein